MLNAGRLRHHLRIEQPVLAQGETGTTSTTWTTFVDDVFASIEPLSVKDYIAAQSIKSKVSVRIVIRYRAGLKSNMRFVGTDGTIYTPQGFLADPDSGREYLTGPCTVVEPC